MLSYQFVFFPVIFQFSKNSLFQKRGAKIGFFNFQCFKIFFFLCLGLLKHYKNRHFLGFFVVEREEIGKIMITEIYEFWFFWSKKWPFRDAQLLFKKKGLKPLFL